MVSAFRLSLAEREEISRGLVAGDSHRAIAARLGRAPSTISREVKRGAARQGYRAWRADVTALRRRARPKACKLGRSAVGNLVERHTRDLRLMLLPEERCAMHVEDALIETFKTVSRGPQRSLTWDQGKEMGAHCAFTAATAIPVYFSDTEAWQRATNENTHQIGSRRLRRHRHYPALGSDRLASHIMPGERRAISLLRTEMTKLRTSQLTKLGTETVCIWLAELSPVTTYVERAHVESRTLPPGRTPKHGVDRLVAAVGLDSLVKQSSRWIRQARMSNRGKHHAVTHRFLHHQ